MGNNDEEEPANPYEIKRPPRSANESLRDVLDNITKEESFLSTLCKCINKRETLSEYDCLKEEDWDKLRELSENNREDITKPYGKDRLNGLMSILVCHPPLDVVKLIVRHGGKKTATEVSECYFNAITYACWGSASLDVIRYLVEVAGEEAVLQKSKTGGNPLHYACIRYKIDDSNSLCDVIRFLIEVGKHAIVTTVDENDEMPLQIMFLRTETPVNSVITLLDQWYPLEKNEGILLRKEPNTQFSCGDFTDHDVLTISDQTTIERFSEVNESFKKIIEHLVETNPSARGRILKTEFMKEYLTERFIQRLPLAVLIADLFSQVLVVYILSFGINNGMPNYPDSATIKVILRGCVLWRLFRELIQLIRSSLCSYLDNISNWIDIAQIVLIFSSLYTNLEVRWVLAFATFLSWIELLFELQNFHYNLAVFVYGAINIMNRLRHFFFTMLIFVATFAHVYYISSTHDADFCNNTANLTWIELEKKFQCTRLDSYSYSFTNVMFKRFGPSGDHFWIPVLYSFVMGIFFISIVVAVICEAYKDVRSESEMTFWFHRLQIVNELEFFGFFSNLRFSKPKWTRQSMDAAYESAGPRINLNLFLHISAWDNLEGDEDGASFHWWYGKKREKEDTPTLKKRLGFFLRRSCWKDIFVPSNVVENILLGKNRSHRPNVIEKCITIPFSVLLLVVSHILVVLLFIFGGISFGLIWPETMKRYLFSENTTHKGESEKKDEEIRVLKKEIRMLREDHGRK